MNIYSITFFVGFMVSEIPRVSVFRHVPVSIMIYPMRIMDYSTYN